MLSDPIADMLTRIRNAALTRKEFVVIPYSKIKEKISKILIKEGYLDALKIETENKKKSLNLKLKYQQGKSAIELIKRVSKPGLRVYRRRKNIKPVLSGYGISIISTPKGLMTNKKARKLNLGGEIICEVY